MHCTNLTTNTCLACLYRLSRTVFPNQIAFLDTLFSAYHRHRCLATGYECPYPQSTASRILCNKQRLPRPHLVYYNCRDRSYLYNDVCSFVAITAPTAKQRTLYFTVLHQLVSEANNLSPDDKSYILDCTSDSKKLETLLYRALYIGFHEPCLAA